MANLNASHTVGKNLSVDTSPEGRRLSLALSAYLQKLVRSSKMYGSTIGAAAGYQAGKPDARVFIQDGGPTDAGTSGAPSTNDEHSDPGQNLCFIVDPTAGALDLYLIYDWSVVGTFTALKIQNTV